MEHWPIQVRERVLAWLRLEAVGMGRGWRLQQSFRRNLQELMTECVEA